MLQVAPDLEDDEIETIVEVAVQFGLQGLIVGNTTVSRPSGLRVGDGETETGGLSGESLDKALSTAVLRRFHEVAAGRLVLVGGAGKVASGAGAYAKIRAGAAVVQLYSGPGLRGPENVIGPHQARTLGPAAGRGRLSPASPMRWGMT